MSPTNFGDWASAVQNVVQAAAIAVGGAWAYYKFVKGRTFHRRAELRVEAAWLPSPDPVLEVKAELENTGGADIPLRAKILRAAVFAPGAVDAAGRPEWKEVATSPVFAEHGWIESQETIGDDVLLPLPIDPAGIAAVRVTCKVYEQRRQHWYRRHQGGGIAWTAHAIVSAERGARDEPAVPSE